MKRVINIIDRQFELFIEQEEIEQSIRRVGEQLNIELEGQNPLFIAVLNGAFMFAGELMKRVSVQSEITFVKLASYDGTHSTESIQTVFGLKEDIKGRTVVIIEDIVDSGKTMQNLLGELRNKGPKEIKIATLLFKPSALKCDIKPDYVALEIPNDFIVGYGLDYNGYGRNLKDIYKVV